MTLYYSIEDDVLENELDKSYGDVDLEKSLKDDGESSLTMFLIL